MAFEKIGMSVPGIEASADLSTKQFLFVNLNSSGQAQVAGAGEVAIGVLQNKPNAQGKACTIYALGSVSKVYAGAAVTAGADVTPDAAGKAVASTSGDYIAGIALDAATAANNLISVFLYHPGRTA